MKKFYVCVLLVLVSLSALAQLRRIELGKVTLRELRETVYPDDTSAHAVLLHEFGESYLDAERELRVVFHYYGKIKIQDAQGLSAANIRIPAYRGSQGEEEILQIKAVSYNLEGGRIIKTELSPKVVFEEDVSEHVRLKKFTFPNARPGSVLEYTYVLYSPYLFNFRDWEFQSTIPTVKSEYWARIPGNFLYNIRLVGPLELSQNESSLSKDCLRVSGGVADCGLFKWAMDSIPAFVEEDYMTAPSDFMPAIRFELSEVRYFDGRVNKITKTWDDLDQELKQDKGFGIAVKRGVGRLSIGGELPGAGVSDLEKARWIFTHFQDRFRWNGKYGAFAGDDLAKSYQAGTGSVAEINLGLVAALQAAGLDAHPFLLSTRENGYPVDIHPVISDFNYVVAFLRIEEKTFLLDATEKLVPFGMLPHRCLSNKGRVMDFEKSYWMEIPPTGLYRKITQLHLRLDSASRLIGAFKAINYDYAALGFRHELSESGETSRYVDEKEKELDVMEILNYEVLNLDSLEKPLIEAYELAFHSPGGAGGIIYLPILPLERIDENPFKLKERFYPVNFGTRWEIWNMVEIAIPENYRAGTLPDPVGISLPGNGGTFILNVTKNQDRINILSKIVLSKPVYSSEEYYYVKELFNRVVQAQAGNIVLEPIN